MYKTSAFTGGRQFYDNRNVAFFLFRHILFFRIRQRRRVISSASFRRGRTRVYLRLQKRRHLRLVAHVVKKYSLAGEADDLISIGTMGLIKGIETYEFGKGSLLATYAAKCIDNEILMYIRANKKRRGDVSLSDPAGVDKDGNEITLMDVIPSPDAGGKRRYDRSDRRNNEVSSETAREKSHGDEIRTKRAKRTHSAGSCRKTGHIALVRVENRKKSNT